MGFNSAFKGLIPVTLKSAPAHCTNTCCIESGILLLEVLNYYFILLTGKFACLSTEHISDLVSNQDHQLHYQHSYLTSTPNGGVRLNSRAEVLTDSNEHKKGCVPAVIWIALLSKFEPGTVQATA